MVICQVGNLNYITVHELATKRVNHGVVVKRHEYGVIVEEQAKLCQVKVHILCVVHTAHDIHIGIINSITVFQQQQVLNIQHIYICVCGLGGVKVA